MSCDNQKNLTPVSNHTCDNKLAVENIDMGVDKGIYSGEMYNYQCTGIGITKDFGGRTHHRIAYNQAGLRQTEHDNGDIEITMMREGMPFGKGTTYYQ